MNRCHVCGKRYAEAIPPEVTECPRCRPLREMFGERFGVVSDWVRAISDDVAEDAVMGHLNDEDHSS